MSNLKASLTIMCVRDGVTQPFPSALRPAVLGTFTYTAQRMSSAPTITATLMYPRCLDDEWTRGEYVEFRGERYYVRQVPGSSKSNEELFYKHELTLVSERVVLENTYFLDVVTDSTDKQYKDRRRSNYTDFSFMGTIEEFAARLTDSMVYSGLCTYDAATKEYTGYHVVIDDDIKADADIMEDVQEISFDTVYLNEALQEIHDTYELSYYFVGKTIHIGYAADYPTEVLEYGKDTGLLTIQKSNADYRIIDRITGVGSSDNIPYYYPNDSSVGNAIFTVEGISHDLVEIDLSKLATKVDYNGKTFGWAEARSANVVEPSEKEISILPYSAEYSTSSDGHAYYTLAYSATVSTYYITTDGNTTVNFSQRIIWPTLSGFYGWQHAARVIVNGKAYRVSKDYVGFGDSEYSAPTEIWDGVVSGNGTTTVILQIWTKLVYQDNAPDDRTLKFTDSSTYVVSGARSAGFTYTDSDGNECFIKYTESGITISDLTQVDPDTFSLVITGDDHLPYASNLMPSAYRESGGTERFYNALQDTYDKETFLTITGENKENAHTFNNPFVSDDPHEGKQDFDDIKPTIKGVTNAAGQLYGELADVAFDENDNDLLGDGEGTTNDIFNGTDEYQHSWFYIKLHKFNGDDAAFNLFDYVLESESAYIEMTSGNCAGCKFQIGVQKQERSGDTGYNFYNPVQVDDNGDIVSGDFGSKVIKGSWPAAQQNTITNEVWLAVKKDNDSFGVLMPNYTNNYRPQTGDTFVITGIKMPKTLTLAAEKRLDAALVKYMAENNDEKFTLSVAFSRVWLQQHPDFTAKLSENARLSVRYNGHDYPLYVSSFTCKADENTLHEITVELDDTLTIGQNGLQKQADAIKEDVLSAVSSSAAAYTKRGDYPYYLHKDIPDTAQGRITFNGGLTSRAESLMAATLRSADFDADIATGRGFRIDSEGNMVADSLALRKFLEVPELRYNRAEVIQGDEWQTFGGGIILAATPDAATSDDGTTDDGLTGLATLHLEDGEAGAVAVGDICIGYWHYEDGTPNAVSTTDSRDGNMTHAGFTTVYFTVTEITETANTSAFRYRLRPKSDAWPYTPRHPQPGMHFACYGSFTDETRRSSALRTRTYTRHLSGVADWTYGQECVMMQLGDLTGLTVGGTELEGYSAYLSNVYISGTIQQLLDLPLRLELQHDGVQQLAEGGSLTVTCRLWQGYDDITSQVTQWMVVRETADTAADAEWASENSPAFEAAGGIITLTYADLAESGSTLFRFTAGASWSGDDDDDTLTPPDGEAVLTLTSGAVLTQADGSVLTMTSE